MKRASLIVFLFAFILMKPNMVLSNSFGMKFFHEKNYNKAVEYFRDQYLAKPHIVLNSYNLALSYFYLKKYDDSLLYFKKVAVLDSPLRVMSLYFMAKIFYKKSEYKSSVATLGKALAMKDVPLPVYNVMLDLWELLKKEDLKYLKKAKKIYLPFNQNDFLQSLLDQGNNALKKDDVTKLKKALELFQLAWVLDPTSETLEHIATIYLMLGDEKKSLSLMTLLEEERQKDRLIEFLRERRNNIGKNEIRETVKFEVPSVIEIYSGINFFQDSNPTTTQSVQDSAIETKSRMITDLSLSINNISDNDFISTLRFDLNIDQVSDDPIVNETLNTNNITSDSFNTQISLPLQWLTRSTRWTLSPTYEQLKIDGLSFFSIYGAGLSFEKYFSRYASYFNGWVKNNDGQIYDVYDGVNWGAEVGIYRYTKRSYIGFTGSYRKENADILSGESFDFIEKSLLFFGQRRMSQNFLLDMKLRLSLKTYNILREDERINLSTSLLYKVLGDLSFGVFYGLIKNDSSVDHYTYDQHQIGLRVVGEVF